MTAALKLIEDKYIDFHKAAKDLLNIDTEEKYQLALEYVEELCDKAADTPGDPYGELIEIIGHSIAAWENKQETVIQFDAEVDNMPTDITLLRVLMDQHGLTGADLRNEVGDKTLVSKILSGERNLTRRHIENLSRRFGVNPALFFD